ncbi:MAG: hypothetical protein MUD10_03250 [Candidatus Pacebacteria bacterium]|jgi:hypothetical protein|nr:hypothetical protein [Candidatus Paceibacterota bacterium]
MKIFKEKFKKNDRERFYWGRVYFISDNREHKTKVIWAMSFEWVRRQLLLETWKDEDVDKLVNKIVVRKWKETGRAVFSHQTQYDPWGVNDLENNFLQKFIIERSEADKCG